MTSLTADEQGTDDLRLYPDLRDLPSPDQPRTVVHNSRKTVLVLSDLLVVTVCLLMASMLNDSINPRDPVSSRTYILFVLLTLPVWPAIFTNQGLYRARLITRGIDEVSRLVKAIGLGFVSLGMLSIVIGLNLGRRWIVAAVLITGAAVFVERVIARALFRRARTRGRHMRRVLIIGRNTEARLVREMLESDSSLGYEVVGFVDEVLDAEPGESQLSLVGNPMRVLEAVRKVDAIGVIVAATAIDIGTSNRLIRVLTENGVHVELSSTLCDIASDRLSIRPLGRVPMVYIEPVHRHGWRALAKRSFDLLVSVTMLLLAAPVLAVSAVAIKLTTPGPVLFRQTRVGRHGALFEVYKFRTMDADAESRLDDVRHLNEASGPIFKIKDDPRVTRIGRVLRKTSIDELPQLINVIRGEMSLVGPRPALPSEVDDWERSLHNRLRVQPGITGMWQVNGRSEAAGVDYGQLDLYYVDNWTLITDLAILGRTIPAVLLQRGAY